MATKFLTSLDLSKNELQNARVQNLATAPSSPVEGQIYWDTAMGALRVYNGGAWSTLSTGSGTVTSVTGTSPINSTGGASPVISIDAASTSAAGAVQLSSSTSGTSETKAATEKAVKDALDAAKSYADALTTDDVAEGSTNKYFTDERAQDAVGNSLGAGLKYTDASGVIEPDLATSGGLYIDGGSKLAVDTSIVTTNNGTQTLINKTLTSPIVDGSGVVFEGATADAYETTLTVVDPTIDQTITLPNATGTVALTNNKLSAFAATTSAELAGVISDETGTGSLVFDTSPTLDHPTLTATNGTPVIHGIYLPATHGISFEGTTDDAYETTLIAGDPTADRTITLPNATGTVALTSDLSSFLTSAVTSLTGTTGEVEVSSSTGSVTVGLPDDVTIGRDLVVTRNLTVNGTTTTVNSTTVTVDDKNLELGSTASPSDVGADGGGITLKGTTDKTITWVDATDAWTSSENLDLASGKVYEINGTSVLSASALGSGITGSSLTSVGTIGTGVWQGTAVALGYGGTGATSASGARDNLAESGFSLPRKKTGSATWTAGESKSLTHNLGTKDVTVALYDSSDALVFADVVTTSTSVVTATISLAGTYRYVIIG